MNLRAAANLPNLGKVFLLLLLLALRPAGAHEFWLQPDRYQVEPGASVSLSLFVGQNFTGDLVGIGAPDLTAARHYTARRKVDLSPALPSSLAAALPLRLAEPGTHLVAIDVQPSLITLPGAKFTEYLQLEGLDAVIAARAAAGTGASPGRERFRRNIKTLVNAGSTRDATFARRTGQRLEIVPLTNPFELSVGGAMAMQVFFDDTPLRGALVKLWNRGASSGLLTIERRTDAQGRIEATLPVGGEWMASVVHMIPATGEPELDWDSYWGNLTFAVGGPSAAAARKTAR